MAKSKLEFKGFEVKAAADGDGTFSGYAATWERDLADDVVLKGAFADSLTSDYGGTGAGIPIYWNHEYDSPMKLVGVSTSAVEDEHGLRFAGRFDLDTVEGKRVYDLVKSGRVHQMSIGFIPEETAWVRPEDAKTPFDGYREIRKLKLFEVSVVTCAANQGAEITEVKAGRAISAANEEKIREAYDALGELLDSISGTDGNPDDGESEGGEPDSGGDDADDSGSGPDGRDEKSAARATRAAEFKAIADWFGGTD